MSCHCDQSSHTLPTTRKRKGLLPFRLFPLSQSLRSLPLSQPFRLFLLILPLLLSHHALAQSAANNFPPLPDLLQYQASKAKQGARWAPFRKYAMRRMRLPETINASDNHLWGYHVSLPDCSFQASRPLYRQLKADSPLAFAVIDQPSGILQLVFWDKRIYRHYAEWLARIGYTLSSHRPSSNTLSYTKEGLSIHIDITIWADCYLMEISG